jgi:hypothetical protein
MSERTESIRKKFLRRLHRVVFQTVPNDANEVDLSKLKHNIEPEETVEFSIEWPQAQDSLNPNLEQG